ncbi:MAG: hypothetical protein A4E58_00010 [Syntrophorhabdus sp. PtaB.Bin006]|nr:MAG: hypothetical protein A4E58_00010 [Syntrophorhabdus sp. PtaB.Bin006]
MVEKRSICFMTAVVYGNGDYTDDSRACRMGAHVRWC